MIIYAVLSDFYFVAKFTITNLRRDSINRGREGQNFMKIYHKIRYFFDSLMIISRKNMIASRARASQISLVEVAVELLKSALTATKGLSVKGIQA